MSKITRTSFNKLKTQQIDPALPVTVTVSGKPVFDAVKVGSLAPLASPAPSVSNDLLLKLVLGDDKDTVHIAAAQARINALFPKTTVPTTPPAGSTPAPNVPASDVHTVDLTKVNWLGEWSGDVRAYVADQVKQAAGKLMVLLVPYNIVGRDNGNYSSGGLHSIAEYFRWTDQIALGIGNAPAVVIVEPDAIGLSVSLNETQRRERYEMLNYATAAYKRLKGTKVYIDSSMWLGPEKSAEMLKPITNVDGFSCNVSGYQSQKDCEAYALAVFKATGLHAVIDTSRNGSGAPHGNMWCNQTDTTIGLKPTWNTGIQGIDAFLWVKPYDESDGLQINGDSTGPNRNDIPRAGEKWPEIGQARLTGDWTAFHQKYHA